jgi:uroporphyrinogen-III synthase
MDNSLAGKRVLLTCEKELAEEFSKKLKNFGAEAFVLPVIEINPVDDWNEVDRYISALENYDWLIFTSRHSVKYFFGRMEKLSLEKNQLNKTKIAAVGESTSNLIEKNNCKVSFIPERFTSDDLAKTLPAFRAKGFYFRMEIKSAGE